MKKINKIIGVTLMLPLATVGCSSSSANNIKVGLVSSQDTIQGKGLSKVNVRDIEKWLQKNSGAAPKIIETTDKSKIKSDLEEVTKESDVISIIGDEYSKELSAVAKENKDKKFIYIENKVDEENVASIIFKNEEEGYVAGYAAALQSKTKQVGISCEVKNEDSEKLVAGFVQGAQAVDKDIKVVYAYSGIEGAEATSEKEATKMYKSGVDVIFAVGSQVENGVIKASQSMDRNDIRNDGKLEHWVIGSDIDEYDAALFEENNGVQGYVKSPILTSIIKNDEATIGNLITEIKNGKFHKGTHLFGFKEGGLRLPQENPNLSKDKKDNLDNVIEHLKSEQVNILLTLGELKERGLLENVKAW